MKLQEVHLIISILTFLALCILLYKMQVQLSRLSDLQERVSAVGEKLQERVNAVGNQFLQSLDRGYESYLEIIDPNHRIENGVRTFLGKKFT